MLLTMTLASMTRTSAANARQANGPDDVGHRPSVRHALPGLRPWQFFVHEQCVQVGLVDDVLRADLPGRQSAASNPTANRLRVFAQLLCASGTVIIARYYYNSYLEFEELFKTAR